MAVTDSDIEKLYRAWLVEKARFFNRACRMPKDFKKNKRMWTIFTRLAIMLEGSPVDPNAYIRACLHGINNCMPSHLISEKGIEAFERFHNLQIKEKSPIKAMERSLDWVVEFCQKHEIHLKDYLFHQTGKSRSAVLHLDIGNLDPHLLLCMPNYEKFLLSLDEDERKEVLENVEAAFYDITNKPKIYQEIYDALKLAFMM